jgi:hypothetical protein
LFRPHLALALALLPFAFGCSCSEPQATKIEPAISLLADATAEVQVDQVDFGLVPTKAKGPGSLIVKAVSRTQLQVTSVTFEDDDGKSAAMFRVAADDAVPFVVGPLLKKQLHLEFAPADPVTYTARVVIKSDDPNHPVVKAKLKGQGAEGEIRVYVCKDLPKCEETVEAPGPYDIGGTYQGQASSLQVQIFNEGLDRLQINSVEFEDPQAAADAGFVFAGLVGNGSFSIAGRQGKAVEVQYKPSFAKPIGPASTAVIIKSQDRDEPEVRMDITATSLPNHPPLACIYVKRVERFLAGGGGEILNLPPGAPKCVDAEDTNCVPIIQPLDTVIIGTDARPGCTGDPDGDHGSRLVRKFTVEGPDASVTDMAPADYTFKTQISGIYTIKLAVTDPLGVTSTTDDMGIPAELTLDVHPVADVAVEVSWGPDADPLGVGAQLVDIDAHLMRQIGSPVLDGPQDCGRACEDRQWGSKSATDDNPRQLTMDDSGFGRLTETILLDHPEDGLGYIVGAHFFADHRQVAGAPACNKEDSECSDGMACIYGSCRPPVTVRVRVYIKGVEKKIPGNPDGRIVMRHPCDFWFAGQFTWQGTGTGLAAISDTTTSNITGNCTFP